MRTPAGELAAWLAAPDRPGTSAACRAVYEAERADFDPANAEGFPAGSRPDKPFVVADDLPYTPHDVVAVIGTIGGWTKREFSNDGPGRGECMFDVFARSAPRVNAAGICESEQVPLDWAWRWAMEARRLIQQAEHWAPVDGVDYLEVKVTEIIHTRVEPILARPVMHFRASVQRRPWVYGTGIDRIERHAREFLRVLIRASDSTNQRWYSRFGGETLGDILGGDLDLAGSLTIDGFWLNLQPDPPRFVIHAAGGDLAEWAGSRGAGADVVIFARRSKVRLKIADATIHRVDCIEIPLSESQKRELMQVQNDARERQDQLRDDPDAPAGVPPVDEVNIVIGVK